MYSTEHALKRKGKGITVRSQKYVKRRNNCPVRGCFEVAEGSIRGRVHVPYRSASGQSYECVPRRLTVNKVPQASQLATDVVNPLSNPVSPFIYTCFINIYFYPLHFYIIRLS
jgi:hypothetical protein